MQAPRVAADLFDGVCSAAEEEIDFSIVRRWKERERRFVEIRYFSKECIFLVRRERRRVGNFEIVHSFSAERRDFRGEKCSSAVAQHARKPRR